MQGLLSGFFSEGRFDCGSFYSSSSGSLLRPGPSRDLTAEQRFLTVDDAGNFFYTHDGYYIFKVDANGGHYHVAGYSLRGSEGDVSNATWAQLGRPPRLGVDKEGNVYISDIDNIRICMVDGYVDTITDSLSRATSFTYDLAGRVASETLPDGRVIGYTYDAHGNVTSITPPGRPAHDFTYTGADLEESYTAPDAGTGPDATAYAYNLDKQIATITRPDAQVISFGYDTGGRLATTTLPRGQVTYGYDVTSGNLTTITSPDGGTLGYTYDGFLVMNEAWTGTVAGSVGLTYDADFRVTSRTVNGANAATFTFDNDGLLTGAGDMTITRSAQNGLMTGTTLGTLATTVGYNTFGEVSNYDASYSGSGVFTTSYTRDKLGRITTKAETIGGVTDNYAYTYDTAGRLTDVTKNAVNIGHYIFDTNSNRTAYSGQLGTFAATYDAQDRLTSYGANTYTYTKNGELSSKVNTSNGDITSYSYDVLGNLMSATLPDGTQIDYVIDARNRRVGKKINGTLTQGFLYGSQLNPVAELDGAGSVVSRFVYGTKGNVPDYMVRGGVTYRIISDHLGSPRLVVDTATGLVAQAIDYDEFGNVFSDTNPGFQPFGFAGGIYDQHTKLIRFGARDYDAETGRWTAKDPIRFNGGDTNLYGYVLGDPINFVDPEGLAPNYSVVTTTDGYVIMHSYNLYTVIDKNGDLVGYFERSVFVQWYEIEQLKIFFSSFQGSISGSMPVTADMLSTPPEKNMSTDNTADAVETHSKVPNAPVSSPGATTEPKRCSNVK